MVFATKCPRPSKSTVTIPRPYTLSRPTIQYLNIGKDRGVASKRFTLREAKATFDWEEGCHGVLGPPTGCVRLDVEITWPI